MAINVPDFMPVLSKGPHLSPERGACIMEYVSFLAGEDWSDSPGCVHPVLASAARIVNDSVDDVKRQHLLPLMNRFFNTNSDDVKLSNQLAMFCAKYVQQFSPDPRVYSSDADAYADAYATAYVNAYATDDAYAASAAESAAYDIEDKIKFLKDLVDEYDRLTGRTQDEYTEVTEKDYQKMYELTHK